MTLLVVMHDELEVACGLCVSCGDEIVFDPELVPSLVVDDVRHPICINCFNRWNDIHRTANGLEPVPLHPAAFVDPRELE